MIRVTFIYITIYATAIDTLNDSIEKKINATLQTKNISVTDLLLDFKNFVNDNGARRNGSKPVLRIPPSYHMPSMSYLKYQVLDLMKQMIYTAQERVQELDPIVKKFENDLSFRMAFIYNKLRQLIVDMRRLYTVAWKWRENRTPIVRVYVQIYWYAHSVRKYFDVLYIVEHTIDLFKIFREKMDINLD